MTALAAFRSIEFQWPALLWLLAALPVLAWLYARRRAGAARGAALEPAGPAASRLRRRLPAALMFAALAILLLAVARPQAKLVLPSSARTIVVAIDISGSMRATDVQPTRLKAAQEAAKAFVANQPVWARVGVVAVAGTAAVAQAPTSSRKDVEQAIDRLQAQRGSALGTGIVIALATLLPDAGIDVQAAIEGRIPPPAGIEPPIGAPRADGAIVLFSDGANNVGPDLEQAAALAAEHGVPVYAVGIGTTDGAVVRAEGWAMRVRLEEAPLEKLAELTGGRYFRSGDAARRQRIFDTLGARLTLGRARTTELSAPLAALGAALAIVAALLSLRWFDRIL